MREGLLGVGLALWLCGGLARATEPPPVPAPEAPAAAAPPVAAAEPVDETAPLPGYAVVPPTEQTDSTGELRVSVDGSVLMPARGYLPVEVLLHNLGATPRAVLLAVEATGPDVRRAEVVTRRVEVGARQRLTTWMLVPVASRGGILRVRSPGLEPLAMSFYARASLGQSVLVVGAEKDFQAGTRLAPIERGMMTIRFLSPEDAPRELAAYVGYPRVVVASDVTALPADVWSALEAYAATGGLLTLLHPPRDVNARLPLLGREAPGVPRPYGFGQVRLCADVAPCAEALLADVDPPEPGHGVLPGAVRPAPPPRKWGHDVLGAGLMPLLPGVQIPVGRFLALITLFVLAVGPGGLLLARRKGPLVLLLVVPGVALTTCLAIVAWSALVDGFALHGARYSVTWLDRERDRALTVGLGAYYANLEPAPFPVPVLGALVSSDADVETRPIEADWSQGMEVTGGFLSPRTYQEWGEVAVAPSRARLGVSRGEGGLKVRNALGAPLAGGYLYSGGAWWSLPELDEGAEGLATQLPASSAEPPGWVGFNREVDQRFSSELRSAFHAPLAEGGFVARLSGPGWLFSRALPVQLHEGVHLVRGRVDGP